MHNDPRHHRIDYIEFSAPTAAALTQAKEFYSGAFGWEYQGWGPEYSDTQTSGAGSGVASGIAVGNKSPLAVIYCVDLEASKARVVTAGGKLTRDIFDFPGGRRFQFTDPAGNELAIWSDK